jgi:hypothetical protein
MAHSLSFLLSSEAATARMAERKPTYVCHMEVDTMSDACMIELDADSRDHAHTLAQSWLTNGRAISAGIRRVRADGTLVAADILDLSDFEDDLAEETQSNLNKLMSHYGLVV